MPDREQHDSIVAPVSEDLPNLGIVKAEEAQGGPAPATPISVMIIGRLLPRDFKAFPMRSNCVAGFWALSSSRKRPQTTSLGDVDLFGEEVATTGTCSRSRLSCSCATTSPFELPAWMV